MRFIRGRQKATQHRSFSQMVTIVAKLSKTMVREDCFGGGPATE